MHVMKGAERMELGSDYVGGKGRLERHPQLKELERRRLVCIYCCQVYYIYQYALQHTFLLEERTLYLIVSDRQIDNRSA